MKAKKYYAPADEQVCAWMIVFADQDVPNETYTNEHSAINRFKSVNQSWTCYLFELKTVENQQTLLHQIFSDITKDNRLSPDTFDRLVENVKNG